MFKPPGQRPRPPEEDPIQQMYSYLKSLQRVDLTEDTSKADGDAGSRLWRSAQVNPSCGIVYLRIKESPVPLGSYLSMVIKPVPQVRNALGMGEADIVSQFNLAGDDELVEVYKDAGKTKKRKFQPGVEKDASLFVANVVDILLERAVPAKPLESTGAELKTSIITDLIGELRQVNRDRYLKYGEDGLKPLNG